MQLRQMSGKKLYTILSFNFLDVALIYFTVISVTPAYTFFFFRKQVRKALSCNRYKMITTKSLLNPKSCGFVKAFLYEKSCQKSSYNEILESYKVTFGDKENIKIDISEIRRRLEPIKKLIQKLGKSDPTRKEEFLSWFAVTKWETIKQSEKDKHSAYHCYQCLSKYSSQLNMLPASRQLHNSHKKSEIVIPIPKENPNSSRFPLMDLTNRIYHSVNEQFQAITGIDFATAQSKSKEIGLQKKKSKVEKQKERRHAARKIIFNIEKTRNNTKVIRLTYCTVLCTLCYQRTQTIDKQ